MTWLDASAREGWRNRCCHDISVRRHEIDVEDATFDPDEPLPACPRPSPSGTRSIRHERAGSCSIWLGARRRTRSYGSIGDWGTTTRWSSSAARSSASGTRSSHRRPSVRRRGRSRTGRDIRVARRMSSRPRRASRVKTASPLSPSMGTCTLVLPARARGARADGRRFAMRFRNAWRAGVLVALVVAVVVPGTGQSRIPPERDESSYTWSGAATMNVDVKPWGGG